MGKTSSLSIRISNEVKEKMKDIDIDWSDYLRMAIENKIKEAKRKNAATSIDKLRSKTKPGQFDSVRSIREDRDA